MRKLALAALFALAVVALTAFSRPPLEGLLEGSLPKCGSDICMGSASTKVIIGGDLKVGPNGAAITKTLTASSSIDFAGTTDTCEESSGITVTGAVVGDVCALGTPASLPHANSWVFCYVSAANTVKVKHCSHGASGNPAAATYRVRVISEQ